MALLEEVEQIPVEGLSSSRRNGPGTKGRRVAISLMENGPLRRRIPTPPGKETGSRFRTARSLCSAVYQALTAAFETCPRTVLRTHSTERPTRVAMMVFLRPSACSSSASSTLGSTFAIPFTSTRFR